MITCSKKFIDLPFAHRQPNHKGHCRLIHGHNWGVEITLAATKRDECGFVFDFGKMGKVKEFLGSFDHALVLNLDDPIFGDPMLVSALETCSNIVRILDCSCEGIAQYFGIKIDKIIKELSDGRARLIRITVTEDSKNFATWEPVLENFTPCTN
jgi:6-pyruvoyltetrahydropterin/6-carboxytetrahydropterin synthase